MFRENKMERKLGENIVKNFCIFMTYLDISLTLLIFIDADKKKILWVFYCMMLLLWAVTSFYKQDQNTKEF